MAARTIVTSHPDVACDVCGRRLLRGEQPDVFLGAGQRRVVCELCTSRATHEGWRRETEEHTARPRTERHQRGRSLLGRLRQLREPTPPIGAAGEGADQHHGSTRSVRAERRLRGGEQAGARDAPWSGVDTEWANVEEEWTGVEQGEQDTRLSVTEASVDATAAGAAAADFTGGMPTNTGVSTDTGVVRALEVFNAGEHPRRVAGVARALGAPCVRAAATQDTSTTVSVVVAWELCWYRYQIDLGDEARGAWLAAEGMELEELPAAERVANAAADERGELSLLTSG
jgi:hypothetical protein